MSDKVRRIDYSADEMIAGIAGKLTPADFGVFWMVCTLIYSRGGPIDDDHVWISNIFKDTHWRSIRGSLDRLVDAGKIEARDGQLHVKRCAEELQRAGRRISQSAQNGRKGGRPSKKNNDLDKPGGSGDEKLTINDQLPTINDQGHSSNRNTQLNKTDSEPSAQRGAEDAPANGARVDQSDDLTPPNFLLRGFQGQVININHEQKQRWRQAYTKIPDINAELQAADDYYHRNPPPDGEWFFRVSNWLKRANENFAKPPDERADPAYWHKRAEEQA